MCGICSTVVKSVKPLIEVAVLASQPLTALRDAIHCEADANLAAQNQSRPAGFFYIEVGPIDERLQECLLEQYALSSACFGVCWLALHCLMAAAPSVQRGRPPCPLHVLVSFVLVLIVLCPPPPPPLPPLPPSKNLSDCSRTQPAC